MSCPDGSFEYIGLYIVNYENMLNKCVLCCVCGYVCVCECVCYTCVYDAFGKQVLKLTTGKFGKLKNRVDT